MSENLQKDIKPVDSMDEWNDEMEKFLGKKIWDSLTYYQKMCEVAAVKEHNARSRSFIGSLLGFFHEFY